MQFMDQLHAYGDMTVHALRQYMAEKAEPAMLHDAMAYSLFAGGKRIRPALCLAACSICGGEAEQALPAACAMEMIHTYSLIHDDLPAMDNDSMRRGKPSNHIAFGEANAILAGDGLLSLAFEVLGKHANARATAAIAHAAFDMVAGQILDLDPATGADQLTRVHRLKTGALLIGAVEAGAHCAGAGEVDVIALHAFAEQYGLLFQITDDILDATGDAATLGKSVGKDAAADKATFVTCFGLERALEQAEAAAGKARAALAPFGMRAEFLINLITATQNRSE